MHIENFNLLKQNSSIQQKLHSSYKINLTQQSRFSEHKGYVNNQLLQKTTGYNFSLPGYSINYMQVTILEKVFNGDAQFRKTREKMCIHDFNTKYKGLNRYS